MLKNWVIVLLIMALMGSGWLLMRNEEAVKVGVRVASEVPTEIGASATVASTLRVDPLTRVLARMEKDLVGVALGFCLLDDEGKVISHMDSETPMIPASTFKTLTTVAALDLLEPEFCFSTTLISAKAVGGKIAGDLVIRGGGDPMLAMADLEAFADALKKEGVTAVEGAVVGDGSLFPSNMAGDFWGWGDVGNGYGSPTSGLNLEHNRFVACFRPGNEVGVGAMFVGAKPEVPGVSWINQVTTGESNSGDGVMIYGGPLATRMLLTGSVPLGADFEVRAAVPDPPMFAAFHLDRLLKVRGVRIGEAPRRNATDRESEGAHVWLEHRSPSLAEILPGLHGRSDNHETECLFQMMGVKAGRPAAEVLADYWQERGVERMRVVDGSGLSRADYISAEGLARVQWLAAKEPTAKIYRESLSLEHKGKVNWKAGGMSSIRSWTGYVIDSKRETMSFGLIFNHYQDGSRLDYWRDELLRAAEDR